MERGTAVVRNVGVAEPAVFDDLDDPPWLHAVASTHESTTLAIALLLMPIRRYQAAAGSRESERRARSADPRRRSGTVLS